MVKFSKQLESQLVPEWKSAFCNYRQLKKDLKQIKLHPVTTVTENDTPVPSTSINHLTRRKTGKKDVILVHLRSDSSNHPGDFYETELLDPLAEADHEKAFFARLDEQLNKVNNFYKRKEEEYCQRGDEIKQQLEKLIIMRRIIKLDQGYAGNINHVSLKHGSVDNFNLSPRCIEGTSGDTSLEINKITAVSSTYNFEFNIPKVGPAMAISVMIQTLWDDLFEQIKNGAAPWDQNTKLNRKKVQIAEKMLRAAFIEFYRGLGLLRSFSSLNMVAFAKILKKYDKITQRIASVTYMKVVERSYFSSSDKAVNLMDEVEKLFTEHFANGDHKKSMMILRPMCQKASHTVTFLLGLFTGGSFAFLIGFIILLHLNGFTMSHDKLDNGRILYMDAIFPLFSMLALPLLHLYMYGWNLYIWRKKRINFAFIFEFAISTEIKHRQVLLVATGFTAVITGGLLGHFAVYFNLPSFNSALIPLSIVLAGLLLLFSPLDVCYRSSRFFFLSCMKHIIFSPFYKVVMADFFLADQLTSQVFTFQAMESVICYNIAGRLILQNNHICKSDNSSYMVFAYLFSLLPYWWRLMQCLRRWFDEHDKIHLANSGKYFSAMVAATVSLIYHNKHTKGWMAVFIIVSIMATGYQLYWDFFVDWGLLHINSKNILLRDQLVIKHKNVYFASMVLNLLLRFTWLKSITNIAFFGIDHRIIDFFFASLEVIRRAHWNFYRLENEHLTNVGKFRAVKTVPLPFRVDDNDV